MSEETDQQVVARLSSGDKSALSELYARYASLLLGVGIKMLRNREEAEDILHDVFMEAWRKADSYDPERGTVRAWFVIRMRSRVVDRMRSAPRRREVSSEGMVVANIPSLVAAPPEAPRLASERKRILDAMKSLPQELQAAVDCVYFRAMSIQETANQLGWPPGTVKSRLFAARKRLRSELAEGFAQRESETGAEA